MSTWVSDVWALTDTRTRMTAARAARTMLRDLYMFADIVAVVVVVAEKGANTGTDTIPWEIVY